MKTKYHNPETRYAEVNLKKSKGLYQLYLKRPLDILMSFILLIVLSPVMVAIAILVKMKHGSPVVFRQERPGLHDRIFTIYKFRTMSNQKDVDGNLLPDVLRLTKFGETLRKTSLDELPELLNILKGDMSFVGPRPLLVSYLPYYNEMEKQRHTVRPGLSGLAQISGRNLLLWEDRFKFDVEYVGNITFFGDLKIILKTFINVINRNGVLSQNDEGHEISFDIYRSEQNASIIQEGDSIEKANP